MGDGSWVGVDLHARSAVAGVIVERTGELRLASVPARAQELVGWLSALPGPVRVAYEAGPTGYGLARALRAAGIECLVAAPSLIARAPAERTTKNDRRDAEKQPAAERDLGLSEGMRESVLASISDVSMEMAALHTPGARRALESVAAAIDDSGSPLTIGERALMRELLARLADES
jgi:transposase